MSDFDYPFWKRPTCLDRDAEAEAFAEMLRQGGNLTGKSACLRCGIVSSMSLAGNPGPKALAQIQCPRCYHVGSIFLHDDQCLDAFAESETTRA